MKFKYSVFIPHIPTKKWTKRPMVQIEVFNKKASRRFNALIDLGADCSLFNIEVAKLLGLDLSKAGIHPFVGISGSQNI